MEEEESLKAGAGVTKLTNAIEHLVDDLLANKPYYLKNVYYTYDYKLNAVFISIAASWFFHQLKSQTRLCCSRALMHHKKVASFTAFITDFAGTLVKLFQFADGTLVVYAVLCTTCLS